MPCSYVHSCAVDPKPHLIALRHALRRAAAQKAAYAPTYADVSEQWNEALRAFRAYSDARDADFAASERLAYGSPEYERAQQAYLLGASAYCAARAAFMAVPVPDIQALAIKMSFGEDCFDDEFDSCLADARRLAGEAA